MDVGASSQCTVVFLHLLVYCRDHLFELVTILHEWEICSNLSSNHTCTVLFMFQAVKHVHILLYNMSSRSLDEHKVASADRDDLDEEIPVYTRECHVMCPLPEGVGG